VSALCSWRRARARRDRHFSDLGNFLIGKPLQFAKHEGFAKLQRQQFQRGVQRFRIGNVKRTGGAILIFNFCEFIIVNGSWTPRSFRL
jgi:hypothetical protein